MADALHDLIRREHINGSMRSVALYSPCQRYRYLLTRSWDSTAQKLGFIMLNPSTATEVQNDPTIERCERRARRMGFGTLIIGNLFAFRATDPRDMKAAEDAVGPRNDDVLQQVMASHQPDMILCAWGAHGAFQGRGATLARRLRAQEMTLWHLGLTKAGEPRHPLYLSYDLAPQPWP